LEKPEEELEFAREQQIRHRLGGNLERRQKREPEK
jgi:hypothetical protein